MRSFIFASLVFLSFNLYSTEHKFLKYKFEPKIDSIFYQYLNTLERQEKKKALSGDDLDSLYEIIPFMEKVTKIKSEIPKRHYLEWAFTKKDIENWQEWYRNNKESLKYDSGSREVFFNNKRVYMMGVSE